MMKQTEERVNKAIETAETIAGAVKVAGGTVYYVGGCVRDKLMGVPFDDIDIEVHGITSDTLDNILSEIGHKREVGLSFGIWGLDGVDIDIAMPRLEEATGKGHRDFKTYTDPFIGTEKAAMRRDFTVNAIMENVLTHELVDHYGGLKDIDERVLRHVNDKSFADDPLRVLRCAGFAARFEFEVADETKDLCSQMSLGELSRERIFAEFEKALLKAKKPSLFFDFLREINKLDLWFPEIKSLIGIEQSPVYHAEGDVYNHTMLVLDSAAAMREKAESPLGFMLSALCHDFGKALTTEVIDGKIHAYRHETEGLVPIREFISRLSDNKALKRYVLNMTEHHMKPNMMVRQKASQKSMNRLFDTSVSPCDLLLLSEADFNGSLGEKDTYDSTREKLASSLSAFNEIMSRPYVSGDDLIAAGIKPGTHFGELLTLAHKLRLAGVPKELALKQVLNSK